MIRTTMIALAVTATLATAAVAVASGMQPIGHTIRNVTVIFKNQDFPVLGPIAVDQCVKEDCSDT